MLPQALLNPPPAVAAIDIRLDRPLNRGIIRKKWRFYDKIHFYHYPFGELR
jgi:hypothetical protein